MTRKKSYQIFSSLFNSEGKPIPLLWTFSTHMFVFSQKKFSQSSPVIEILSSSAGCERERKKITYTKRKCYIKIIVFRGVSKKLIFHEAVRLWKFDEKANLFSHQPCPFQKKKKKNTKIPKFVVEFRHKIRPTLNIFWQVFRLDNPAEWNRMNLGYNTFFIS